MLEKSLQKLFVVIMLLSWLLTGWPTIWHNPKLPPRISVVQAVAAGPLFAGTGANFNDGGNLGWTNPTDIQGDTTSTAATINLVNNNDTSQRLRATNFGFSIPSGAIINGVTVEIETRAANTNRHFYNSVQLLKEGAETGNNNSDSSTISNSKSFKTFGSSSDGWGATLTSSDVNNTGFGVSIKIIRNSQNATTTSVFRVRITVEYTTVSLPTVTTQAATDITTTSATANGNITSTGGVNADTRGFVYDTSSRSLPGNVVPGSSGYAYFAEDTGSFGTDAYTKNLTSLTSGLTYYVRAYARNSAGYSYGNEISFTTVLVSVSITTDGTVSYGILSFGESKSTIELSDTQTAQNAGNVAIDLNIATDAPSGWTLGSSPSTDIFVHEFSTNSGGSWTQFTTANNYHSLYSNVAASATRNFDLRFTAPNPSTTNTQKTITITIQAVQH
jgi:hypothetical protein